MDWIARHAPGAVPITLAWSDVDVNADTLGHFPLKTGVVGTGAQRIASVFTKMPSDLRRAVAAIIFICRIETWWM